MTVIADMLEKLGTCPIRDGHKPKGRSYFQKDEVSTFEFSPSSPHMVAYAVADSL